MRAVLLISLLFAVPVAAKGPSTVPALALLLREATPAIDWRWRAAPEAATQPGLLKAMRSEAQAELGKARAAAARDAAEAKKAGFPFRAYETINDWSLAADTPALLALAGEVYSYTGGAHGNTGYAVRLWDKAAKRSIPIDALFTDWPRARKLLEPAYCKALAAEQARRRQGTEVAADFAACPKLSEQPVVPFAGLARQARQFRVLLAPYTAGPYAEGSYLITAPWPEAVRPFVKPAYQRDLFGE